MNILNIIDNITTAIRFIVLFPVCGAPIKEKLGDVRNIDIYADKIYNDRAWFAYMRNHSNVTISVPVKLKKGQKALESIDKLYNSAGSSIRQHIESFFSWLQEKTKIQCASNVRFPNGLLSFI